jgi:glycosyltransferase involved in cell wall biosynthesis
MSLRPRPPVRLLLGNKFWFPKGGVETYLFELIDELPAHGYDVVPFAMRHPDNLESAYADYFVDHVDYHAPHSLLSKARAASRMIHSRHAARKLTALVEKHPVDLAHFHNVYHQLSPAVLPVLADRGIPVLMTLHDLKLACPNYKMRTHGEICERCKTGGYHHAVLHRCVQDSVTASALCALELFLHRRSGIYERHVDRFIVPSAFYLRKLAEAGVPAEKLVHIPSFTDIRRYAPSYGGDDYFVYVGRLAEVKGLLTLVEAARDFKRGTLVIVGDGPMFPVLERAIEEKRIANVRLAGPKYGHELIDIVRRARFSVIPSEWYENCPRSCIESFACGTPVIGARIGGIPEMVEDGVNGLLFTPFSVQELRSRIEHLFNSESDVAEMGRAARRKAEREYSTPAHLAKLLSEYAAVLARSSNRVVA